MKDTLQAIIEALCAKERELGLDNRSSWFSAEPADGGSLGVELSRPELLAAVENGLPGFSIVGSAPGLVEMRSASGETALFHLSGSGVDTVLWTVASVADIRREPDHSSELLSQAIMGETMTALERRGDWFRVRMEDDYHGWVRSWHVAETPKAEVERYRSEAGACVGASVGYVRSGPEEDSIPVSDVTA
ncbi:MAG: SH3 domain-containing protein, partial [Candidatus Krumholzibacteria bacterium]|nr:SH3 domain-containing protein [Candidatus Krumholzibacteria bacterium]